MAETITSLTIAHLKELQNRWDINCIHVHTVATINLLQ